MVTRLELLAKLPKPNFSKVKISSQQTAKDIIKEIRTAQGLYAEQYKLIAQAFKAETITKSAYNVWKFLKEKLNYVIEKDSWQTSKSPAMFLTEAKGDCKHYSLFTVGILTALGYKCKFRFTSYKLLDKTPQHVYTLVQLENGNWMPVDAVINEFGVEKPYSFKEDYGLDMSLYRISGIGEAEIGKSAKRAAKQKARKEKRAKRKAEGKGIFRKIGRGIAKVALTPVRAAYTSLIGLNLKGMAKRLNEAIAKDPEKVKRMWTVKFKGNWKSLLKSVARGSRKGKKFTPAMVGQIGGIGAVPFAAAMAAAAPIIIAMAGIIKEILGKGATDEDTDLANEAAKELAANPNPSEASINNAVKQVESQSAALDRSYASYENSGNSYERPEDSAGMDESDKNNNNELPPETPANDTTKILMYVGGGLLAAKVFKII